MKCQKHNCEMEEVGKPAGFGQAGRLVCPECAKELEALRPKIDDPSEENRGSNGPRHRNGWGGN